MSVVEGRAWEVYEDKTKDARKITSIGQRLTREEGEQKQGESRVGYCCPLSGS